MFRFKEFDVCQEKSAMKIGTDSVLLGAWAPMTKETKRALDIGSGTGILSLMVCQRCPYVVVDAVEIDQQAFEECTENIKKSKWKDKITCHRENILNFEVEQKYDFIISNPPFFSEDTFPKNENRKNARNQSSLSFDDLLCVVEKHIQKGGIFCTIIPFVQEESFLKKAKEMGFYPQKITRVRGNEKSQIKRSLMAFENKKVDCKVNLLTIEKERHLYTREYYLIVEPFYANKLRYE